MISAAGCRERRLQAEKRTTLSIVVYIRRHQPLANEEGSQRGDDESRHEEVGVLQANATGEIAEQRGHGQHGHAGCDRHPGAGLVSLVGAAASIAWPKASG